MSKVLWVGLVFLAVGLMFVKIWLGVSISSLAYRYHKLEQKYKQEHELYLKLRAEEEYLLSPGRLRQLAKKLGLRPPGEDDVQAIGQ